MSCVVCVGTAWLVLLVSDYHSQTVFEPVLFKTFDSLKWRNDQSVMFLSQCLCLAYNLLMVDRNVLQGSKVMKLR